MNSNNNVQNISPQHEENIVNQQTGKVKTLVAQIENSYSALNNNAANYINNVAKQLRDKDKFLGDCKEGINKLYVENKELKDNLTESLDNCHLLNEKVTNEKNNLQQSIQNLQSDNGRLKNENENLKNSNDVFNTDFEKLQSINDKLTAKNNDLNTKINNVQNDIQKLTSEKDNLINQINDLNQGISKCTNEKNDLQKQLNELLSRSNETKQEYTTLTQQIASLKSIQDQYKSIISTSILNLTELTTNVEQLLDRETMLSNYLLKYAKYPLITVFRDLFNDTVKNTDKSGQLQTSDIEKIKLQLNSNINMYIQGLGQYVTSNNHMSNLDDLKRYISQLEKTFEFWKKDNLDFNFTSLWCKENWNKKV